MESAPNTGITIDNVTDETENINIGNTRTESREFSSNVDQGCVTGRVISDGGINYRSSYRGDRSAPSADSRLFFAGVSAASADTALSIDGENYINELRKGLKDNGFRVERFEGNPGCFIVSHPDFCVIFPIIFQETLPRPNGTFKPYTEAMARIFNGIQEEHKDGTDIISPVLITPNDYPRVKSMATSIEFAIRTTLSPEATINALRSCRFRVVTDQNRTQSNLRHMYPGGVIPYHQYAVSVEVADPSVSGYDRRYYRDEEVEFIPLFTLGGYTEFLKNDRSFGYGGSFRGQTFTPLINVSVCAIRYMSIALLPLAIRVAYNTFLGTDMWLSPFRHFNNSGYNLGNLALDENGKPCVLNDSREFDEFVDVALTKPILCLEITGGLPGYPAFSMMTYTGGTEKLKKQLAAAAGVSNDSLKDFPASLIAGYLDYASGVTNFDGQVVDTRTIDYFKICKTSNAMVPGKLDRFLHYSSNIEDRIDAIADSGFNNSIDGRSGVQSLYTTQKFVLAPDAVRAFLEYTKSLSFPDMPYMERGNVFSSDFLRNTGDALDKKCFGFGYNSGSGLFRRTPTFGGF